MDHAGREDARKPAVPGWQLELERAWWRSSPGLLPTLLRPLALLYRGLWRLREALFDLGLLRPQQMHVPVVVVGNVIVGGAGKTPTVIALVEALRREGWQPGVVSRGYGSTADAPVAADGSRGAAEVGDEPLLIHRRTGVPVWVGRDRVAVARALLDAEATVDLIVADDGLQHRRLHRDAQFIVFDERGIGNGLTLPAGPLREPWAASPPRRSVVLYNAPRASTPWPGFVLRRTLGRVVPLAAWRAGDTSAGDDITAWRNRRVHAAAGIAVPARFFDSLQAAGLRVVGHPLPDHAPIDRAPWPPDDGPVLVTEKDAVKLTDAVVGRAAVHVVTLDSTLPDAALAALRDCLPARPRP